MTFLAAALYGLALSANAQGDEAVERANKWIRRCLADNPGQSSNSSNPWDDSCVRLQDPCKTEGSAVQQAIPRCNSCVEDPDGGPSSCDIPRPVRIEKPRRSTGGGPGVIDDSEDCIKYFLKLEVWERARGDHEDEANNVPKKKRMKRQKSQSLLPEDIACRLDTNLVQLRETDDSPAGQSERLPLYYPRLARWQKSQGRGFKVCDPLKLRDAQHYFENYCNFHTIMSIRLFPNLYCSMTAGYTAGKAIGIIPRAGRKKPSPPSRSEIYWGCNGIWHAQDDEFPYMTDAESGSPP